MSGTFGSRAHTSSGISLLTFNDGRIAETCVYRQATPAEMSKAIKKAAEKQKLAE